jgi:hypothetical protein
MTVVDACLTYMPEKCKIGQKTVRLIPFLLDGLYAPETRMDRALESYFIYIYTPIFITYFLLFPSIFPAHMRGSIFNT